MQAEKTQMQLELSHNVDTVMKEIEASILNVAKSLVKVHDDINKLINAFYKLNNVKMDQLINQMQAYGRSIDSSNAAMKELVITTTKYVNLLRATGTKIKGDATGVSAAEAKTQKEVLNVLKQKQTVEKTLANAQRAKVKLQQEELKLQTAQAKVAANTAQKTVTGVGSAAAAQQVNNMKNVENAVKESTKKQAEEMKKLQTAAKKVYSDISKIFKRLSIAVVAAGGIALKSSIDFEYSIRKIQTIASDSTETISRNIRQMAMDTGSPVDDLSEALYQIVSAVGDIEGKFEILAASNKLAIGGFTDTNTAVDVLTTVMNAYGMSAAEVTRISDLLVQTQIKGKTTVGQLAQSLGSVIPTAAAAGVSFDDVSTAMALMTSNGIKTREAGTALNAMLTELSKSGSKAGKAFAKQTGVSFMEFIALGGTLGEAIQEVKAYADDAKISIIDLFNIRAFKGAQTIINSFDRFEKFQDSMKNSSGAAQRNFEIMMDSVKKQLAILIQKLKEVGLRIGDALLPRIRDLVDEINKIDFEKAFSKENINQMIETGKAILAIYAALKLIGALASLITFFKNLALVLGSVKTMAVGAATAIGATGTGLVGAIAGLLYLINSARKQDAQNIIDNKALRDSNNELENTKLLLNTVLTDLYKGSPNPEMLRGVIDGYDDVTAAIQKAADAQQGSEEQTRLIVDAIDLIKQKLDQLDGKEINVKVNLQSSMTEGEELGSLEESINKVIFEKQQKAEREKEMAAAKAQKAADDLQKEIDKATAEYSKTINNLPDLSKGLGLTELETVQKKLQAMEKMYTDLLDAGAKNLASRYVQPMANLRKEIEKLEAAENIKNLWKEYDEASKRVATISEIMGLDDEAKIKAELDRVITMMKSLFDEDMNVVITSEWKGLDERRKALEKEYEAIKKVNKGLNTFLGTLNKMGALMGTFADFIGDSSLKTLADRFQKTNSFFNQLLDVAKEDNFFGTFFDKAGKVDFTKIFGDSLGKDFSFKKILTGEIGFGELFDGLKTQFSDFTFDMSKLLDSSFSNVFNALGSIAGNLVSDMFGLTNTKFGSIGTSAGSLIGTMLGGPLGGALGSVAGGMLGNVIGGGGRQRAKNAKRRQEQQTEFENLTNAMAELTNQIQSTSDSFTSMHKSLVQTLSSLPTVGKIIQAQTSFYPTLEKALRTKQLSDLNIEAEFKKRSWKGTRRDYKNYAVNAETLAKYLGMDDMVNIWEGVEQATLSQLREYRAGVAGLKDGDLDQLLKNMGVDAHRMKGSNIAEFVKQLDALIGSLEKLEKESAALERDTWLSSFSGVALQSTQELTEQFNELYKSMGLNPEEYAQDIQTLVDANHVLITVMQDVQKSFINFYKEGDSAGAAFVKSMSSYFDSLANNIATVVYGTEFSGINQKLEDIFLEISETMATSAVPDIVGTYGDDIASALAEAMNISDSITEDFKGLREKLIAAGIPQDLVEGLFPGSSLDSLSQAVADALKSGIRSALDANDISLATKSMGDAIRDQVTDSLIEAFVASFITSGQFDKYIKNIDFTDMTLDEAFAAMQGAINQLNMELAASGLGDATTGALTPEDIKSQTESDLKGATITNNYYQYLFKPENSYISVDTIIQLAEKLVEMGFTVIPPDGV